MQTRKRNYLTLLDGEKPDQKLFVRLIEQPPEGYGFDGIGKTFLMFTKSVGKDTERTHFIPIPYANELWLRETWLIDRYYIDGAYIHYNDGTVLKREIDDAKIWYEPCHRYSPVTMPKYASRKTITVDFDVKWVQEFPIGWKSYFLKKANWESPKEITFEQDFADWWNAHHAKPVWKKDHYEAYPWDRQAVIDINHFHKYHENIETETGDRLGYYDTWKGKPLHIYPNPYVLLLKVRE